jgi:phospholipase C
MPHLDRRRFLQLTGSAAALSMIPTSIARAASIPARRRTGTIQDVQHVVVLMQENRSFDHYFGALRGVRGFGDPHPAMLPSGRSVWHQSDGTTDVLPFRPDHDDLGLAFIRDLDHGWDGGHAAFNGGNYDRWVPVKTSTTMAHLERRDVPFHYALADAFTICDSYHCSLLGPTDPNRYYMWTGWVGNDGTNGGPVIANDELGYDWTTYPERLQQAGVSWKIYQDAGDGLDKAGSWGWTSDAYIGNYGDNALLYFHQYQNAADGSPLAERARTGTDAKAGASLFDQFAADVRSDRLPQVSWIVAPEAFTEHPNWPADYGAWYVAQVLDALTANPDVWAQTALFLTYDENDGFFDHVVPPYPNVGNLAGDSTVALTNEYYPGSGGIGSTGVPGPYGLGQRVPMTVISPWSTGGWVCSETFDHTSIIRFLEARFGVHESNITPWRRAVCGDLTSAFDFDQTRTDVPRLPATAAYRPADDQRHPDYVPVPPTNPMLPAQERGVRPSRALGYDLGAAAVVTSQRLDVVLTNTGHLGAHLQARSATLPGAPFSYTVGLGDSVTASWPVNGAYDVSFHGPNGFFRRFAGNAGAATVEVSAQHLSDGSVGITVRNSGAHSVRVTLASAYDHGTAPAHTVRAHDTQRFPIDTGQTGGWYDVTVTVENDASFARVFAGRVETGHDSVSDPQLSP